ncbi:MAG: DEAD/DEAH box helicase, partial [candidate division Zixibacteria bacterium]|nr:DEAD/DEAH box helicase [candidate division Zixibacteria bacterium]
MRIEHLARYGIPAGILASWKKHFGSDLLPVQSEAVQQYGLLNHSNLLISSPTSSGKTFCAEIAAIARLFQGGKVIYLIPLKAIAEEKYCDFCDKYAPLGIKILISTKDHPESDLELDCGNFDLAFVVYEKFNQLLIRNPGILARLALIIIDEVQL